MKVKKRLEKISGQFHEIYYYTINLDEENVKVEYAFTDYGDKVIVFHQETKNVDDNIVEVGDNEVLYLWDEEEQKILRLELYEKEIYTIYHRTSKNKKTIRTRYWIKKQYKRKPSTEPTYEPMFYIVGLDGIRLNTEQVEAMLKGYQKINCNSK